MVEILLGVALVLVIGVLVFCFKLSNQLKAMNSHAGADQLSVVTALGSLSEKVAGIANVQQNVVEVQRSVVDTRVSLEGVSRQLQGLDVLHKDLNSVAGEVSSLQSVLTDKKSRGAFGEAALGYVLENAFGAGSKLYELQYTFASGARADAVVHAAEPLGLIVVDSKFPLENFRNMMDAPDATSQDMYTKQFKVDVKKHIDDISSKYIIDGVTAPEAIMFLPAEGIFAELYAHHEDVIDYAFKKHVWITSPTTLMATMSTISIIMANIERDRHVSEVKDEIDKLAIEFGRYEARWATLGKDIDKVLRDVKDVSTTTDKMVRRFSNIMALELED